MTDERDEDVDPTTYVYWREHGFRGPPPKRRGPRWSWLAASLALVAVLTIVLVLAASGRLS